MKPSLNIKVSSGTSYSTLTACLIALGLFILPSAYAAVLFSDTFAYSAGNLVGQGPSPGSPAGQGTWAPTGLNVGNAQVSTYGLTYPGIVCYGNKATISGVSPRSFGNIVFARLNHAGGGNSTVWAAFIMNVANGSGSTSTGFCNLGFAPSGPGDGPAFGLISNNRYGIVNYTPPQTQALTNIAPSTAPTLFVVKLDFAAGVSYLFINPSTVSEPSIAQATTRLAMASEFKSSGFDQVIMGGGQNTAIFNYDQVRVGNTFADVVDGILVGKIINISTRALVQTGASIADAGFIISGTGMKTLLVRGLGPTLGRPPFNISGTLANPTLELHHTDAHGVDTLIATNDNWQTDPNSPQIPVAYRPPDPNEAALYRTLAPGNYTAVLKGVGAAPTGIGLVEVYDLETNPTAYLTNISTRAFVGSTSSQSLIGGFITSGTGTRVSVRALGPTLAQFGVPATLQDPIINLNDANQQTIGSNDNWQQSPQLSLIEDSGFRPGFNTESAIVPTRPTGSTTAVVTGKAGTTGVCLVEVDYFP